MSLMRAGIAPLVSVALLCGAFGQAGAQQNSPAPAASPAATPPALNVLVVDIQSLLQNSKSGKMAAQQLQQKKAEYATDFQNREESLIKERDTLQRQQASLSPEDLRKKARDWQLKANALNESARAKDEALVRANNEALESIQSVVFKIISEIAKERKANMVFQRSQLVLFDNSFDVTDQVLAKLDEQLPTLTVSFASEKAGGSEKPTSAEAQPAKQHHSKKKQ